MSISFSGLASGLDTSSWVESLVALKKAKVTSLEEQKQEVQSLQETLSQIKSFFSSFRSMLEKVTDAKLGAGSSMDLFAQNLATSSNLEALTAAATSEAEEATYNVQVDKLATETRANSNYSYMTTIVQTTTATADSKLINLGVKAGDIGVTVNGVKHGISITENDTISTFIEKLQNIGVKASYNENTGIFSVDISAGAIEQGDTKIVDALHLGGVNEGYTSKDLSTTKTDTVYSAATEATKLSELGVKAGTITINANDKDYNITIKENTTLGDFIKALNDNKIDATLDKTGVFTISDATIKNEGNTGILNALGLAVDIFGKSQTTGNLKHEITTTQTTTATSSTKLKDLEGGSGIKDGDTVVVKNSNNEEVTITLRADSTLGDLLTGLTNAGMYAAMKSDGTIEISGGTITGGTFKAEEVLGLEKEPYTAMVTGNPLTETVEVHKLVDLSTRLVDDLEVNEGYLEVTDADGNTFYEKIYSGQTIADFMTDMGNLGINTRLDESTGVLTITGGAFETLTDTDVQALIDNHTITETEDRYKKGTNLLECLYGSGTISTDHISVASAYSKTKALRRTVTVTVSATKDTTLGNLGLTGNGTAIFDVRGEERTINVTSATTIDDLIAALKDQGIAASWDEDNSRITIENATLTGGTSNLADVLDLTTTVAGKYVTSSELYAKETISVDATRETTLDKYGITNSMSAADRTLKIYDSEGNLKTSTVLTETMKIGDILDLINNQDGITAALNDSCLAISNGYVENTTLETSMGLKTSNKSSYVLGSVMTVTTTAGVTGESTLKEIFEELGTTSYVDGGYNLTFNNTEIDVGENTTLNDLINKIYENGGTASLDKTGRLAINGGVLAGSVAQALGMNSTTHQSSVSASGETLYTKTNVFADRSSTFKDLGITGDNTYTIYNSLSQATTTVTVSDTTTIGDFLDSLKGYGIDGTISNGTIRLTSPNGTYIKGALPTALGITDYTTTETVNTNQQSTESLKQNVTKTANTQTTLGEIGGINDGEADQNILIYDKDQNVIGTISNLTTSSTIRDMFDELAEYDIVGKIEDGIISLTSPSGNYAAGKIMENLGIGHTTDENVTYTVGQTTSSSLAITYTDSVFATRDTKLKQVAPTNSAYYNVAGYDSDGNVLKTIQIDSTCSIGEWLDQIEANFGVIGTIENGVITWTSDSGNYIQDTSGTQGDLIKIDSITTTVGNAASSTIKVTYVQTTAVERTTNLSELSVNYYLQSPVTRLTEADATAQGYTCVHTAQELHDALSVTNAKVMLMNDIDVGNWTCISSFSGTFDGNGYTLSNMNITGSGDQGMFRALNGTVENLVIANSSATGSQNVGILAGSLSGNVSNSSIINSSVISNGGSSSAAGLLAGAMNSAAVSSLYVQGTVTASSTSTSAAAGGIVGIMSGTSTLGSSSVSDAIVTANGSSTTHTIFAGGTIGNYNGGSLGHSYTYGSATILSDTTLTDATKSGCGGAIGGVDESITSLYLDSNVHLSQSFNKDVGYMGTGTNTVTATQTVSHDADNYAKNALLAVFDSTGNLITTIDISTTASVQDFFDAMSPYGISSTIKDGRIVLSSTNGNYVAGMIPKALGIDVVNGTTTTLTVANASTSTAMVTCTVTESAQIGEIKRATFSGSSAQFRVLSFYNADGTAYKTITFQATDTLGSVMAELRTDGFDVTLTDGVLSISSDDHKYVAGKMATYLFGMSVNTNTVGTTATSTAAIEHTYYHTMQADTTLYSIKYGHPATGSISASGVTGSLIAITTAEDLYNLANLVNSGSTMSGKTFVLMNNISLADYDNWVGIGNSDYAFQGTFDGGGFTISNLNRSVTTGGTGVTQHAGLFNIISGATVKNVNLSTVNIAVTQDATDVSRCNVMAGALVGYSHNSNIYGIKVTGLQLNELGNCYVGGVVGYSYNTTISNCKTQTSTITVDGSILGSQVAGGIAGIAEDSEINVSDSRTVISSVNGNSRYLGGVVGIADGSNIQNTRFQGKITDTGGADTGISYRGGIVGEVRNSTTTIDSSIVQGTIQYGGTEGNIDMYAGAILGIARANGTANISNCYAQTITGSATDVYKYNDGTATVNVTDSEAGLSTSQLQTKLDNLDSDVWYVSSIYAYLRVTNEYSLYYSNTSRQYTANTKLSLITSTTLSNGVLYYSGSDNLYGGLVNTLGLTEGIDQWVSQGFSVKDSTTKALDEDSLMSDLLPEGASGYITIQVSSSNTTVMTVGTGSTIAEIKDRLATQGITLSISDGMLTLSGGHSYIKGMSDNLKDIFKLDSNDFYEIVKTNSDSGVLSKILTGNTTLADLGITSGQKIVVNQNGKERTISVSTTTTMETLMNTLGAYGVTASITASGTYAGRITIGNANDDNYVKSIDADLMNALKLRVGNGYTYKSSSVQNYTNTTSDELLIKSTITMSTTSTFGDLGFASSTNGVTTVRNSSGQEFNITMGADNTVSDFILALAGAGITASVRVGVFTINANSSAFVTSMDDSMRNALGITRSDDLYTTDTTYFNKDSDTLTTGATFTAKTDTTFSTIGLSNTGYITVVSNGTQDVIEINPDQNLGDLLITLAGYGIAASLKDGMLTIKGNSSNYVEGISDNLQDVLHLEAGEDKSWHTEIYTSYVNTNSGQKTFGKEESITGDTVLSTINGMTFGNLVVYKTDGTFETISVDTSKTLDEFFEQISGYGLVGSIDTDGIVTITGVGNVYLQAADGGSNILTALKLGNVVTNVKTVTVNRTSNTLNHTVEAAASGATKLSDLIDSNGNTITFTSTDETPLILTTESDAGNQTVTLNFSKTSTIYGVIDKLAEYGINATIDARGKFSVSSSTLTDFDISGTLGKFLMTDSYIKKFGEDTTTNISSILKQKEVVNMDDSTELSEFGVTGGNITINQEGVKYTVDVSALQTVGDFRNLLSKYGFNSYIDDKGRLNVIGVGNSTLESIDGGSNILDIFGLTDWSLGEITQQSGYLGDTQVNVVKIGMKNKLSELTDKNGNNLGITSGQIFVYQDGTRSAININADDTFETLAAKLSQYGITVGLSSEGKLYFDGNNDSYLTTDGIASASASNILDKIGVAGNWSTRYDSTSKNLSYTETKNGAVDGSTKLKNLKDASDNSYGITSGSYYIYQNGVRNTETIVDDTTVNDFMATLAKYGLTADIDENGSLSVGAYNNTYLATSALAGDNSNVVSALFEQWNFVNIYTSNNLDIPTDEVRAITRDTKLADINEGTYNEGLISVIHDGVKTNISLSADATVGTLMDELALYGFEAVINSNGQLIIKNTGDSKLENYTGTGKSNALELLGIDLNSWINTNNYKSGTLNVTQTTTLDASATRDTLLSELGVSTGEYYIYNNGVKYTAMISSDETLGSFMDTLKSFGIETSLVQGADGSVLKIVGKGDSYIKKSGSVTNSSNVVEKLFGSNVAESNEYSGLQQTFNIETTTSAATEETRLDYFGVTAGDLNVIVNGQSSTIKISADETVGSLIEKFNALGLNATLSGDGQIMIQSGYDTMTISATGTTSNVLDKLGLKYKDDLGGYSASETVVNSTTSDIVEKTLSVANFADLNTKLGTLNISDGTLTIYKNGQKATIEVKADQTFNDLRNKISTAFSDVDLTFADGKLKIYSKVTGNSVEVGATTDSTNFSAITGISKDENGASVSARELYCVNGDSVLTTSGIFRAGDVKAGTFKIGDAEFTIDNTTTLSNLIAQINSSEKANATAFWDNVDGKFVIKSKTTGSALVNIEAGTSNFTDILGLTSSTWNAGGAVNSTKMNIKNQEIGENAKVKINGTTYTSTSNTITSDVTRIKGLTINLKGLTNDSAVTLKVERDKETLANAVSGVVDSYNELMKNLDESMASDGDLRHESTLKLIRNQLRNLMTSSDAGTTVFKNLDSIGISVAAASGSNIATSNSAIVSMTFDEDKFFKAYEADQDAVKALLIGSSSNKGIFSKLETEVESALAGVSGYFATTEASYKQKVKDLDAKIKKANKEVDRYKTRLESKFQSMDMLIAQMQQQYSSFLTT